MAVDGTTAPGDDPGPTGIRQAGLVVNNGSRILDFIKEQLRTCDEFWFGVAFLTSSGVAQLKDALAGIAKRGSQGWIFVSDYNTFTQPSALRELREFENIEARLLRGRDFHGKGFLFRHGETYHLMVGSANLTEAALNSNDELNLDVEGAATSPVVMDYRQRFDRGFAAAAPLTDDTIDAYEQGYTRRQDLLGQLAGPDVVRVAFDHLEPNKMQAKALARLRELRAQGKAKALLISATGTGKTVLSALDVQQSGAKSLLFVAHRQDIILQAKRTFDLVFRGEVNTGLYDTPADAGAHDFVFATTQKLSRRQHLSLFDPGSFEYVIVDEAHHATASSYRKILAHFKPAFLLGMTATPERMDQLGKEREEDKVFQTFGNTVAYEIRLHEALESALLSPFRYYGITKLATSEGTTLDDLTRVRTLPHKELMAKVIAAIKGRKADRLPVRGLVFCSNIEEAKLVTASLNQDEEIVARLDTSEKKSGGGLGKWLDGDGFPGGVIYKFLVAVDKYNEGVDIPRLNQVVMLRPTESIIVFVQQLGRGLRRAKDKKFLTVLDFIGAHKKNYLIPNALYGFRTRGDDELREMMMAGAQRKYVLPSGCQVEFDGISRQLIFKAINERGAEEKQLLQDYQAIKRRLGRIPMMCDFDPRFDADPKLLASRKYGSYYGFLAERAEADSAELPKAGQDVRNLLAELAKTVNNGARPEEPLLLALLLAEGQVTVAGYCERFQERFGHEPRCEPELLARYLGLAIIEHNYGNNYETPSKRFKYDIVQHVEDRFECGRTISADTLTQAERMYLMDCAEYAMRRFAYESEGKDLVDGFVRYSRYTCEDIQRILNRAEFIIPRNFTTAFQSRDEFGRMVDSPILVYYHKDQDNKSFENYHDRFDEGGMKFHWTSTRKWRLKQRRISGMFDERVVKHLFVRKHKHESRYSDYIFVGKIVSIDNEREVDDCVRMTFTLDKPVEAGLLDYITSKEIGENDVQRHVVDSPVEADQPPITGLLKFD